MEYSERFSLKGRVALVTGGCYGIGFAIACALAEAGASIAFNAPFIVSKAVIPGMIKKGHGKIINVCSMMSELGRETVSAYAAAKGGLKMLTRNIASEYGRYNIQCNGIGPGYIETPPDGSSSRNTARRQPSSL